MLYLLPLTLLAAGQPSVPANEPPAEMQEKCPDMAKLVKKISKTELKKTVTRISKDEITDETGNIIGYSVNAENLYISKFMLFYTANGFYYYPKVTQKIGREKEYSLAVSRFLPVEYSSSIGSVVAPSKYRIRDDRNISFNAIKLEIADRSLQLPETSAQEHDHCSIGSQLKSDILVQGCLKHFIKEFQIDQASYHALASSETQPPFTATALYDDGIPSACPLYFSAVTLKAAEEQLDNLMAALPTSKE